MVFNFNELVYNIVYSNPIAKYYYNLNRKKVLTRKFLSSADYDNFMLKHIDDKNHFIAFIDDAQQKTRNFRYRHFKANRILGSWRWKGIWLNKNDILPIIFSDKKGIDFGGAFGPISYNSIVVDFAKKDIFGRKVKYATLDHIDFKADYIFSSHTLEHIKDLEKIIDRLHSILVPKGTLILNLPSYSCIRWQAGIHSHEDFNDHAWSFYINEKPKGDIKNLLAIDELISKNFNILKKEYTGDNSIFIYAKK